MWFDKDPAKSEQQREQDLFLSATEAVKTYTACEAGTAWEIHTAGDKAARRVLAERGLNSLVSGFGPSLVDAAMVDGLCRYAGKTFHQCLQDNVLGLPFALAGILPARPVNSMALRHTIGLGDPLLNSDITEPINDGLPESLEQVIAAYRPRYFKIKVNNNAAESRERLVRIAAILDSQVGDYQVTLDGNEAFGTMDEFEEFFTTCEADVKLATLWSRILWIEQPVARNQALEGNVRLALERISERVKVIIDESDGEDDAFDRALSLGYRGISAKNCKGIFRTLQSFARIHSAGEASPLVLSSEDLTNQPLIPNQQDLCVAAALGINHSERNGHHFFKGFEFIPQAEQARAAQDYPELYSRTDDGQLTLKIENGAINLTDVNSAVGLGVKSEPDWDSMEPVHI